MRPWVDSVFRGRKPKATVWADKHGVAIGSEIRLLRRIGFDGEGAVIVGVTDTHCFISPDQQAPTEAGTEITLADVEAVHLTSGFLSNVVIETTGNYYRLPSTYRPRAVLIASTIADGAGLTRNTLHPLPESLVGQLRRYREHIGIGVATVGVLVTGLALLIGAGPVGLTPGLALVGLGIALVGVGRRDRRAGGGLSDTPVWSRSMESGSDPPRTGD